MHWQLIVLLGFAISSILFLVVFFLYSNLRVLQSATQRVFRLWSDRTRDRSMSDVSCHG